MAYKTYNEFPQCNFSLVFPEILSQNVIFHHWLSVWEFRNNALWDTLKHALLTVSLGLLMMYSIAASFYFCIALRSISSIKDIGTWNVFEAKYWGITVHQLSATTNLKLLHAEVFKIFIDRHSCWIDEYMYFCVHCFLCLQWESE